MEQSLYYEKVLKKRIKKANELIGTKFGRLEVIGYDYIQKNVPTKMICKCDCGVIRSYSKDDLQQGKIKSCGCARLEHIKNYNKSRRVQNRNEHLYHKWIAIKERCYNKNATNYYRYGGVGITMCNEWVNSPEAFIKWAELNGGNDPTLTIDRIDPYKGYSPDNCRFATIKEQARNKKNTVKITIDGQTKSLTAFCEEYGVNENVVRKRIYAGWPEDLALKAPRYSKLKSLLRQCNP